MLQISGRCQPQWLFGLLMILGCSRNDGPPQVQPASPVTARAEATSAEDASDAGASHVASPTKPVQGVALQATASRAVPIIVLGDGTGDSPAQSIPTVNAGTTAPAFVSRNLAGDDVRLSDWRDKIVVLDFWATWCGPCLASLPHMQEVAKSCKDQGVIVLATCTGDTRENFEQFVKANQQKYPDLVFTCDPNEKGSETFDERASRQLFGVSGIPTQFVIGRDGKIAAVLVGYEKDEHRLEDALLELGVKLDPAQPVNDGR